MVRIRILTCARFLSARPCEVFQWLKNHEPRTDTVEDNDEDNSFSNLSTH